MNRNKKLMEIGDKKGDKCDFFLSRTENEKKKLMNIGTRIP